MSMLPGCGGAWFINLFQSSFPQFDHVTWPTVFMPWELMKDICLKYFGESISCILKVIVGKFIRSCLMLSTDSRPSWLTFISFSWLSFWQMMHNCNCDSSDSSLFLRHHQSINSNMQYKKLLIVLLMSNYKYIIDICIHKESKIALCMLNTAGNNVER